MPAMFALGEEVIANSALATFAAFGSFAMLLLVDFGGPLPDRLRAQAALALAGCALVCLGTLVSQSVWLAAATMTVVGFAVIFAGVVSSVVAAATTALLLAFILPATIAGGVSTVTDRVAGWGLAGAASVLAVGLLWPAPEGGPLLSAAVGACRALAERLRADVEVLGGDEGERAVSDRDHAIEQADDAVAALRRSFLSTPYRPSGLSTADRTIVNLVDELGWLNTILPRTRQPPRGAPAEHPACTVKLAAAGVLQRGADVLEQTGGDCAELHAALAELTDASSRLEDTATTHLLLRPTTDGLSPAASEERVSAFITSLDPSFRAQELGFAVSLIGVSVDRFAAAERRSWRQRVLGRAPEGMAGTLSAAQRRATAHVDPHSVWLHNSVRGAVGLGLAVFVADRTGVQHSFWVVLGTLSVLRSNALNTGESVVRAISGTVAGFIVGAAILALIGTDTTLLWFLLPPAVFLAGLAPAVISFVAGQAAFTLTVLFLFNIIQPLGWRVGLLRVEDVALGCAVSLVVGLMFWPRGAGAALRRALADAYAGTANYLASAVDFGMLCCDSTMAAPPAPDEDAARAAAAASRLDDTFRSYLAERGAKPVGLAEVTSLVSGVSGLRLAADAVLDLWRREDGPAGGERTAARKELLEESERVKDWYEDLAHSLLDRREPRQPLTHDAGADRRLVDAVGRDLRGENGRASATAVRMIWTSDHLDAARRLQGVILPPARAASGR